MQADSSTYATTDAGHSTIPLEESSTYTTTHAGQSLEETSTNATTDAGQSTIPPAPSYALQGSIIGSSIIGSIIGIFLVVVVSLLSIGAIIIRSE